MALLKKEIHEGHEISGKLKHLTEERVLNFSGGYPKGADWPSKNIHTDIDFAHKCGLKTRAVSAAMFVGFITEMMVDNFGEEWLCNGQIDLKFISMVDVGQKVIAKAVVKSKQVEQSRVKCNLDVWMETDSGDRAVVGEAMGYID